jgi:hypothetical protein
MGGLCGAFAAVGKAHCMSPHGRACYARPGDDVILRIIERGLDRAAYEALRIQLDIDHQHPLGLIMHGAVEVDGTMRVAQIWESEWYATRFDEDILEPALDAVGAPRDARVTVLQLEHLITP